jgi:hypothetical protein
MKYLCTSETLFSTINQLNEFRRAIGDVLIPAAEREILPIVRSVENSIENYFFATPKPALNQGEKEVLKRVPFTIETPKSYPITPYRAPASTNSIVHTPPKEIMIPGRNRKGEIEPYRESKPKNAIEPYKFEKIKVDPEPKSIVKVDPEPKPIVKPEPKPKVKESRPKFPFPFGGIDTPNRGAGSVNEPASISDLPLNLRVDSIGSYATRQRM